MDDVFTFDIDVIMEGVYRSEVAGRYDALDKKWIGRIPARIENFRILKYNGHGWIDITHVFEPKELEQRRNEYLTYLEERKDIA